MSPFILEENVLYKLPLTILSLRQQSLRTSLRIHVKAEPQPHCTLQPGQLADKEHGLRGLSPWVYILPVQLATPAALGKLLSFSWNRLSLSKNGNADST